jgi:hypothetical protein
LEALIIGGYVRGLSDRDIESLAKEAELGHVSKTTVSRICRELRDRYTAFCNKSLADVTVMALFMDAVYLPTRPSGQKEGVLVVWGYTTQGNRLLLAVRLGQRESHEDWLDLGRDLTRRGLRAPWLVVSDGAPGLIKAIEELWPEADRGRCAVHRTRKESTYRSIGAWWCCGQQFGRGAVAGGCLDGDVPVVLEERVGFPDDVADGSSADVAEGVSEDVQGAQPSVVQDGEQDAFAVANLLREDAAAGTRLAWATAPLVTEALTLSCLARGEPLDEGVQLVAGESGQGWVGEPLDNGGARGAHIAVEEGEQIGGRGEADGGHAGVIAVVIEDLAGLFDVAGDTGGGDLQEFSQHIHRADLPLVQQREQEPCGIVEQRPVTDLSAGPPGPAAALFAVALLGAGSLGRSEPGRELFQLRGAHAGQPLIGELAEDGLATLGGTACLANGC